MHSVTTTGPDARTHTAAGSAKKLWAGRIMSGLAILFLLFDAIIKFVKPVPAPVTQAFAQLGYPPGLAVNIGVILLACVVVYAIPRTSVLGAILLTGYLGGAIASHVRVGDPLFSHVLFPAYVALLIWGGLYLRDDRLRALVPLRDPERL
jgi:DoxX-like family